MPRTMKTLALGAAILLYGTASAQSPRGDLLARVPHLDCAFTASAVITWVSGQPHVDVRRGPALSFRLDNIDTAGGTAHFIYGTADTPIVVALAGSTLHFIDRRLDGSMAMTTVLGTRAGGAKFRATYSHTQYYAYDGPGFASVPQVEQYYGYCSPSAG
jgi:hypothetical protein